MWLCQLAAAFLSSLVAQLDHNFSILSSVMIVLNFSTPRADDSFSLTFLLQCVKCGIKHYCTNKGVHCSFRYISFGLYIVHWIFIIRSMAV